MILKPFAAFGHVLMQNTYKEDETFFAIIGEDIKCTTFWVKGAFKNKHITTNEDFRYFPTGTFLRPPDYIPGTFEHQSVGESVVFCFDQRLNGDKYVELVPFILTGGAETVLPVGTKLFLCSGILTVSGNNIGKPTQLHIRSGDSLVTAVTDCYGLIFP
jgi:hypothetical protein